MSFSVPAALIWTWIVVVISFLGAKLLYLAEGWQTLSTDGITFDGVSFFGAVFVLPVVLYGLCRRMRLPYAAFMDWVSPSLMCMLAVLRIGCWLSGCCGGITYQTGAYTTAVVPVQLMECVLNLMMAVILLVIEANEREPGFLYPSILLGYGAYRFLLEFVRDTPKNLLHLSNGQWLAVLSVILGLVFLRRLARRGKQNRRQAPVKRKRAFT